ncbi:Xanthine and CO dehydrogenases maturation factor, XdhC/CoxF family [hydrothermal vent metagenome]|uniref:Xanthine and CO dehydrogenases maturation factor, XdhC/CoxF family n=1 Tax=hydrothermal vent metagenome TaxID=652676 RepID=A0A3B1DFV1_9ZZZZ
MESSLLIQALKASQIRKKYAFATIVESTVKGTPRKAGAKMLVWEDGSLFGSIGGGRNELAVKKECLKAIKLGKSGLFVYDYFGEKGQSVCGGQIKVFVEPVIGQKHFIICGAGHIALSLSMMGKILNYEVTIIDNRKAFACKERFPHVDHIIVGQHASKLAKMVIDRNTYIMIVTQGNEYDFECLRSVVKSEAGYIGVISSKRKRQLFFERLKAEGIANKFLKCINIPAGLDIGAQTPQEIAVSIVAELTKCDNKDSLRTEKFLKKES